jgi:hypothetical protein
MHLAYSKNMNIEIQVICIYIYHFNVLTINELSFIYQYDPN